MISVCCRFCSESCEGQKISDAMEARRIHEAERHREAKVETDTSTQY